MAQQVGDQYWSVALIAALATSASLVPLVKGVEVKHADLGPFRAAAERLNGRLAMLAFAYFCASEAGLVPGSGQWGEAVLASARVQGFLSAVRGAAQALDLKAAGAAAALALLLAATTSLATLAPFQLFGGDDDDQ